jgi:hypothetical protein
MSNQIEGGGNIRRHYQHTCSLTNIMPDLGASDCIKDNRVCSFLFISHT